MVKEDLGDKLTTAASSDTEWVPFQVGSGETASTIAERLEKQSSSTTAGRSC